MIELAAPYFLLALALYALLGVYVRARAGRTGPALAFLAGLMAAVLVVLAVGGGR